MTKLKNTIKKIFCTALCLILTITIFAGCSSNNNKIDFIYPFSGDIKSFDPQIAKTADEFLLVENCFEGLVRVNDNGKVQAGVAKTWEISNGGKTYTFHLRQGAKWNVKSTSQSSDNKELTKVQELMGESFNPDITANDFVFALQRACEKNTDAPLFSSISNIVNASKIHSGKLSSNKLGVTALDDYTLEINLKSADDGFLNVLATAVAMPCNKDYFDATKGRYGLGLDYTIFNGQFYVSNILEASYILKNNKQYVGDFKSAVTDITLKITDKTEDAAKNLKSGYYDAAYITGQEYDKLKDSDITAISYTDATLAMVLNKNNTIFSNDKLRQAVCLSISDIDTKKYDYLSRATSFTPPSCKIGTDEANKAIGTTVYKQNISKAQQLWKEGLNELGASQASFNVIATEEYKDTVKELVQGIQAGVGSISAYGNDDEHKISFSLKVNILSESDYQNALSKGDYDIALYKFTATNQSPLDFLSTIINGNYIGTVPAAISALKKAQNATAAELAVNTKECETAILADYSIKPVLFESSYYAQASGVKNVQFHPGSGRVSFVNATREEK